MFSGIIEELGKLKKISKMANLAILDIESDRLYPGVEIGESIAVNGVCLTVVKKEGKIFRFEVMLQTLKITNLGELKEGERVNLERALVVGDRVSGHFVSGHIDCVGLITQKRLDSGNICLEIKLPLEFMPFIVSQGSVAVDGISFTIAGRKSNTFSTCIIPHTMENTTLKFKGVCDKVNIECDMFAKYVKAMIR